MIKAAIFDFNGTMILDKYAQVDAWREAILKFCHKELTMADFNSYIVGVLAEDTFAHFLGGKHTKEELFDYVRKKEQIYFDICLQRRDTVTLANGFQDFIEECISKNIKVSIGTGAPRENMEFAFKTYELDRWFSFDKIVYDDGTIIGKPDPCIYLKVISMLDVKPEECCLFEDTIVGVEAGIKAGIQKIFLLDPYKEQKEKEIEVLGHKIEVRTDYEEIRNELHSQL